jgi:hypothetical protein
MELTGKMPDISVLETISTYKLIRIKEVMPLVYELDSIIEDATKLAKHIKAGNRSVITARKVLQIYKTLEERLKIRNMAPEMRAMHSLRMTLNNPSHNPEIRQKIMDSRERNRANAEESLDCNCNGVKTKFKGGMQEDLGHFTRSSWETNVARILKYLKLEYEFEPTFQLQDGRYFHPDFYLKDWDVYIEVKGRWLGDAKQKLELWQKQFNISNLVLIQEKDYKDLKKTFKDCLELV